MNPKRVRSALTMFSWMGLCLWAQSAVAQVVLDPYPTYYNVSGFVRTTADNAPNDRARFGPLPLSDGTSIQAMSEFDASDGSVVRSMASASAGSATEQASVSSNVVVDNEGPGSSLATWAGLIKNDSTFSRILVVHLFVFTDQSSQGNIFTANATLGSLHYRGLTGYPGEYALDAGVIAPGAFVDFSMTTVASFNPDVLGGGDESLRIDEIEWSPSSVPELPPAAMLLSGLALLMLLRGAAQCWRPRGATPV